MPLPDRFTSDLGLKSDKEGKKFYVAGYISTDEVDTNKEVVPEAAMKAMVEQLKSGAIKLDIEHETFLGKADVPIGRITEARLEKHEGKTKIFVKAELNNSHNRFPEVWNSIQNRFIDAFSIAYKVKEAATQSINGVTARVLKSIDLLNVALTGNPVNRGCTMTEAFMKSLAQMEDIKLTEEIQAQEVPATEVVAAPTADPVAELKSVHDAELKAINDTLTALKTELKSLQDYKETAEKTITELKAQLEAPQLKAVQEPEKIPAEAKVSVFGMIR